MIRYGASILSADFSNLEQVVRELDSSPIDFVHIDVMDGHFVPNITFGPQVVKAIRSFTNKPFDVHLMISEPAKYLDAFLEAGADEISLHVETATNFSRAFGRLRRARKKTSLAINPKTSLGLLEEHLDSIDRVLLMGVEPGFGGQAFIEATLDRARELRSLMEASGSAKKLQIDGGVGAQNIKALARAGFDEIVAGNALYGDALGGSVAERLAALKAAAEPSANSSRS